MNRYLVMEPHTPEECLAVLDDIAEKDRVLLEKFDWGCIEGDHTGYARLDAIDDRAALDLLPAKERVKARVIKLTKFTPEQIRSFHEKG